MIWMLLLGLFGPPTALLLLGHHWARTSRGTRRLFWGMLLGHSFAWLPTLLGALWPPVLWTGTARSWVVHGSLLAGAVLGALLGALYDRMKGRPQKV